MIVCLFSVVLRKQHLREFFINDVYSRTKHVKKDPNTCFIVKFPKTILVMQIIWLSILIFHE